jgi:hypothetical protein
MFGKAASFMQLCFRSARDRLLPFKESTGVAQPGPLAYPKPFCGDQPGAAAWTARGAADARRSFITQDGDKGKRDPSSSPTDVRRWSAPSSLQSLVRGLPPVC